MLCATNVLQHCPQGAGACVHYVMKIAEEAAEEVVTVVDKKKCSTSTIFRVYYIT